MRKRRKPLRTGAVLALAVMLGCGGGGTGPTADAGAKETATADASTATGTDVVAETAANPSDSSGQDLAVGPDAVPDVPVADLQAADAVADATAEDQAAADTTVGPDAAPEAADAAADTCTGPTCVGAVWPAWQLVDFQPKSKNFGKTYGLNAFVGQVTVVGLLAAS